MKQVFMTALWAPKLHLTGRSRSSFISYCSSGVGVLSHADPKYASPRLGDAYFANGCSLGAIPRETFEELIARRPGARSLAETLLEGNMFSVHELEGEKIEDFSKVLIERYYWLIEHDIKMWSPDKLTVEGLYRRYKDPKFYGGYVEDQIIGGFILVEEDERYWPENTNDKAFYFHKFVISPKSKGKGYSNLMIQWVKDYGKKMKKEFIRLDYQKRREYLRKMYLENGFIDQIEIENDEGDLLLLAEYKIV